jgi:hypothetical protein
MCFFSLRPFLAAGFTVIMRHAKLDPIHAAALVSTGSFVIYVPAYFLHGIRIVEVPLADLTIQVIFQGIVVTIISLVLYGRAVGILGGWRGLLALWCQRYRRYLQYRCSANGRTKQIGSASS